MAAVRIALLNIRLVMRTKVALFFTFLFPVIFLFVYAGLFAHGNPEAVAYVFGPVVTLNIMGSGFWGLGLQSVVQRERGSLRRYRLAPVGPGTIVTSNLLANYLLELPTIGLLLTCAILFFHMPVKISWLTLLALVTVGTFAFAGFGLTIASVANTMQEAQVYNNLSWLALLFLSGVTVPLPLLPHWIQRVAPFLPATYLVSAFQAVMVQSQPLLDHWAEMLALIVSGTFGLLLAWKLFRWEKEERIPTRRKVWSLLFVAPFLGIGLWMNTRANPMAAWAISYSLIERASPGSGKTTADETANLIEGFDNQQADENLLRRWQISTDTDRAGHSMAEITLISPGASGTQNALRLKGRLAPVPGGQRGFVAARCNLALSPGAKDRHGIEFSVRGDSWVYQINLRRVNAAPSLQPSISFVPSTDWQSIRLPLRWLAPQSSEEPPASLWVFEIVVSGPPGEFAIDIDEIKFY